MPIAPTLGKYIARGRERHKPEAQASAAARVTVHGQAIDVAGTRRVPSFHTGGDSGRHTACACYIPRRERLAARSLACASGYDSPVRAARPGFTLLEFEVALTLLGIGLVGLFPLVVMQSRAVRSIENRLSSQASYYLVASSNAWARKLGAPALLTTTPPAARAAPPVLLVDNGDDGYSESGGGWTTVTDPNAFQGQYRLHPPQDAPQDTAAWQFSGLAAGWFQLQATWLGSPDRSTQAAYTCCDGEAAVGTYPVSQQAAPSGTTFRGCAWQTLATIWLNGPTASVSLSAQSDGSVAADGARLVPLRNDVQVLSLDRAINGQDVQVLVQVNAPVSP